MLKLFLPFIGSVLLLPAAAQQDSVRRYLDADFRFTTKKEVVYAAMAIHEQDHWMLYAVYPDTSLLMKVSFSDAALRIKDGPFTLYHPKKKPAESGFFKNNIPEGHWQFWYPDGQIKNDGFVTSNHLTGTWKSWYQNGRLMGEQTFADAGSVEQGTPVHESSPVYKDAQVLEVFSPIATLEGPATSWYESGIKEAVVNYHHDSLSGECRWFRQDGKPSTKETYTGGQITALECYDEQGKYTGNTCSILKPPILIHPMFSALEYIEEELHKDRNKDIRQEGEASISFTITKSGKVENLIIVQSPDEALSRHIIKIFNTMPAWSPAIIHNCAVDYPVKLEVPYYRN